MEITDISNYYIGAHVAKESTILKTMQKITKNDGNALQIFVSNPRSAAEANIEKYKKDAPKILEYCEINNFKIVIHSSYIINLAREPKNNDRLIEIGDTFWIKSLISELVVSHIINSIGVVVHVGKYTKLTPDEGLNNMGMYITYLINFMKTNKIKSKIILETPAGQGTELLTDMKDFTAFYNSFTSEQKKYLGICIDTAHVWSNGYDVINAYQMLIDKNIEDIVLIHLNNSKKEQGSKVDVHAPIFEGIIPVKKLTYLLKSMKELHHSPVIILEDPSIMLNNDITWIKMSLGS